MYDIIGDIHGYANHLELLLDKMGYQKVHGVYSHPTRKAIFLGDLIDRGPKVKETVGIVKKMVEKGHAECIMANHEFNYICFFTEGKKGPLRAHTDRNLRQNEATRNAFSKDENLEVINWFTTLPLWIEKDKFRCIHACWEKRSIEVLRMIQGSEYLTTDILKEHFYKGSDYYNAIEATLKGLEVKLPGGVEFKDSDGNSRTKARLMWWDLEKKTSQKNVRDHISQEMITEVYQKDYSKLTFFGHYWLDGHPYITNPMAQCLDFSIAASRPCDSKRNLVAYRFNGEDEIIDGQFEYVNYGDIS